MNIHLFCKVYRYVCQEGSDNYDESLMLMIPLEEWELLFSHAKFLKLKEDLCAVEMLSSFRKSF